MEITLKIPDEMAARAKERGVEVESYLTEALRQLLGPPVSGPLQPRTSEEIRNWLDSLAQFSHRIPPLPETITREWLYQEHN